MIDFMKEAIKEANKALFKDEVPIGAVIVKDNKIIARGYNRRQTSKNALDHAEMIAIEKACKKLASWHLVDCDIYVTLEPCPMCSGAIANARIRHLYYACRETSSNDNLCEQILSSTRLNHKVEITYDESYSELCQEMLSKYFKEKRKR